MKRKWTDEEVQQMEDWIGVYSTTDIAKKLKRTRTSVQKKMQHMGYKWFEYKERRGVGAVDFASRIGASPEQVYYWVKKCDLPIVKLPKYMTIKNKNVKSILIDDTKLGEWFMKGWVYVPSIKPVDKYYRILMMNALAKLDCLWISGSDIIKCCNITPKILDSWKHRNGFPRPVFYLTALKILKFNRQEVINWARDNPQYIKSSVLLLLHTCGIGEGR